jgi:hypothetical protein
MTKPLFIFAMLASLLSISAMAATDSPTDTSSNNLLNLTYFPHVGKFAARSDFYSTFHETSGVNTVSNSDFSVGGTYGFLVDGLRASASASTSTVAYTSSSQSYYYSGINDPTFNLNYRLLDNSPGGWSFDVELGTSPSLGTYYIPSSTSAGSNRKGFGTLSLSAAAYWTFGINEFKLSGGIDRQFSGNVVDPIFADNTHARAARWNGDFAVTDRVHFGTLWFAEAGATFDFSSTENYSYADGTTSFSQAPFRVIPTIELGYLPTKQLLIAMSMSYQNYTTLYQNTAGNSFNDLQERTAWDLSATLEF